MWDAIERNKHELPWTDPDVTDMETKGDGNDKDFNGCSGRKRTKRMITETDIPRGTAMSTAVTKIVQRVITESR